MFKVHLRRMLIFMVVLGLLGWVYASSQQKIYQAVVNIQAGSPPVSLDPNLPTEIQRTIAPNLAGDLDSDVGLLKSAKIFRDGLIQAAQNLGKETLASPESFNDLYRMYEVRVPDALNQYAQNSQRVVAVQVRAYTPEAAAEIANQVGVAFSNYRKNRTKVSLEDATRELKRQLQLTQAESTKLSKQYQETKEQAGIADATGRNQAITQSLETLKIQLVTATNALAARQSEISQNEAALAATARLIDGGSTLVADTNVDLLKQQVSRAEDEYESLRSQFQDSAPFVQQAKAKLDRVRVLLRSAEKGRKNVPGSTNRQINPQFLQLSAALAQARADAAGLRATVAGLEGAVAAKRNENVAAPAVEVKLQRILRDREIADMKYAKLQTTLSNYENGASTRVVSILDPADPSTSKDPVAPEVRRWVIVLTFAGALLGLAYSFTKESLQLPVHTSWQLSELTALPVAAAVPAIPKPLSRRHEAAIREGSFKPITSFRTMAFSTLAKDPPPRTVLFTGVGGEVGAAAAAAEFAIAVARTGTRTILVDADLRSPALSTLFGFSGQTGVSDILGATVLAGGSTGDLTLATEHENLTVLAAGSGTDAGIADFQSQRIAGLLDDLRERSDMVVISCPPVDVYSDAARLAPFFDENILVVSAKTTSYRAVPMAQEILEKAGAKNVQIVLTNASPHDEPFGNRVSDALVRS